MSPRSPHMGAHLDFVEKTLVCEPREGTSEHVRAEKL